MGLEEFSLIWEDHDKTLLGIFERLRESKTFVDCTITAEGQYLKAHKIMLSACSPYFELLFKQENEKNPIIIFKDIKFKELKAIVDFMYRGKVEIPEDSLGDFVEAAESLQINGLRGDHGRKVPNQSPTLQRRESHASRTTRKRRKKCLSLAEMSPGGLSPESDIDDESNISENLQFGAVDVPSPQSQQAHISMNRHSAAENMYCEDASNVEIQPCTPYIQQAVLPTETLIEDVKNVVKTEPELRNEIFVPESECLTNVSEECVEDTTPFDYDDENVSTQEHILNQETSNQYSALPYVTETANEGPDDIFEVPPEAINSQGFGREERLKSGRFQHKPSGYLSKPGLSSHPVAPSAAAEAMHVPRPIRQKHSCPHCHKHFRAPSLLKNHVRVHTGEKPFECETCHRSFSQRSHLNTHLVTHTGLWPHSCNLCNVGFSYSSHLAVHMRRHTGERPHQCSHCSQSFSRSSNWYRHLRRCHKVVPGTSCNALGSPVANL